MALEITSQEFEHGGPLAHDHAREGADRPPTLRIDGVPDEAVELAIVCHDPDAPMPWGFTHWTLYGVPPDTSTIDHRSADDFRSGENDFGGDGYGGPHPPRGHGRHHYYFWVYALGRKVEGEPSRLELLERHGDDVIELDRIVGTYER